MERIREFRKRDWEAYAGVEAWANGETPILADQNEGDFRYTVVIDSRSVQMDYELDLAGHVAFLKMDLAFPTQAAAKIFLSGLPYLQRVEEALKLGFQNL